MRLKGGLHPKVSGQLLCGSVSGWLPVVTSYSHLSHPGEFL